VHQTCTKRGLPVRRATYHHGDARNAILRSARRLLERTGAATLSLRQVAETAGLSRQAPYNHFASKEALLAELVRDGFVRLAADIRAAADPKATAQRQLAAAGEAYITFALSEPTLFRLMFSRELVDLKKHPSASKAADDTLQALAEIVRRIDTGDRRGLVLASWSIVHGYAVLCIEAELEGRRSVRQRAAQFAGLLTGR
jgi:AcrR family transcriptional regulator